MMRILQLDGFTNYIRQVVIFPNQTLEIGRQGLGCTGTMCHFLTRLMYTPPVHHDGAVSM